MSQHNANFEKAAHRLALAHLERLGFNKFNAPEVMRQLLTVLGAEGLDETVDKIKSQKVPQLVDEAWRNRAKKASQAKYAMDMRRMVLTVFERLTPFVKNRNNFLKTVLEDFLKYEFDDVLGLKDDWDIDGMKAVAEDGGMIDGNPSGKGWDPYQPPDYEEEEYMYPSKIQSVLSLSISVREWPKMIFRAYRPFIKDAKGFIGGLRAIVADSDSLKMLGRLYAQASSRLFANASEDFVKDYMDALDEFAQEHAHDHNPKVIVSWSMTPGSAKVVHSGYKLSGGAIQLSLVFTVEGTADADMAGIDDDPWDRYAAAKMTPSRLFDQDVKEMAAKAKDTFRAVGAAGVMRVAFHLAEEVNWSSLARSGLVGDRTTGSAPLDLYSRVEDLGDMLRHRTNEAATFIVALFRLAGKKAEAEKVKAFALKALPQVWEV